MAKKLRNPLAFYGYREQNVFNSYENNSSKQSKEIDELRKKNEEQDKRDEDFDHKIQENDKKDEEQDESIKQAIDKSLVSLEMSSTPSEGSYRTYIVKQGGNDIGKIEIPFSSLVKSATYDPENNLLIFTVDNDKEIKVDLTKLIEDSDLVQRKIFDDFKNEVTSFSSDTVDSISELSAATSNASGNIKELEQKLEDTSYTTAKALNKLNDDIEDAFDDIEENANRIEENSIKIKNIEEDNSQSNASLNELSAKVETFSSETENNINNLKEDADNKFYVVSKSVNDVNDKLDDFEDEANEKFKSIDQTFEDKSYTISKSINDVNDRLEDFQDDTNEKFASIDKTLEDKSYTISKSINNINDKLDDFEDDTKEKFTSIDKTFEDKSYVISKALNELKDGLDDAIDESMVIRGTGENSAILKDSGSIAKGKNSLALGTGLVAANENEIALGKYNDSTDDTAFSFGIGSSESDRKNAIEIKKDGNIYIWSEGKYVCLNEIIGRVDVGETY